MMQLDKKLLLNRRATVLPEIYTKLCLPLYAVLFTNRFQVELRTDVVCASKNCSGGTEDAFNLRKVRCIYIFHSFPRTFLRVRKLNEYSGYPGWSADSEI